MKQKRLIESEKDVQHLIFDYPWLLDINFERVASSAIADGWEVTLRTGSRLDILFRNRMDGSPVIVEFKRGEFYRENIGQLMDYRASVLREIYDPQTTLSGLFGNRLFQPTLCLVVKKCDDFARSACALAGIRVFEYQNNLEELRHIGDTRILKDIGDVLKEDVIPLDVNRPKAVDSIYSRIRTVLSDLGLEDSWRDYRKPSGEYFEPFNHMFVNKSLFEGRRISLGIYEDILNAGSRMAIEFFSYDEEFLKKMEKKIRSIPVLKDMDCIPTYDGDESYLSFFLSKTMFLKRIEAIVKGVLVGYQALFGLEDET